LEWCSDECNGGNCPPKKKVKHVTSTDYDTKKLRRYWLVLCLPKGNLQGSKLMQPLPRRNIL
jgi:hypothetical protein